MSKIISVANQKGGVGKTTTVVNLASCLAQEGRTVLLVDLDPQGNATSGCGINKKNLQSASYNMLIDENFSSQNAVIKTNYKNLSIIPSTIELAGAELELAQIQDRSMQMRKSLSKLSDFDYIFIDCPPSLGLLTINALSASDSVLIPIQCEFYALEGLSQLMITVKQVKRLYNPLLEIEGVLVTMYDGRLNLTSQVLNEVKKYFADKTFKTVIPRNVRISEAPSHGKPINYYDKGSKGSKAYFELARELVKREKKRK